jgi:hypothetical protein
MVPDVFILVWRLELDFLESGGRVLASGRLAVCCEEIPGSKKIWSLSILLGMRRDLVEHTPEEVLSLWSVKVFVVEASFSTFGARRRSKSPENALRDVLEANMSCSGK